MDRVPLCQFKLSHLGVHPGGSVTRLWQNCAKTLFIPWGLTSPSFCTSGGEGIYITAIGSEIEFGVARDVRPPGQARGRCAFGRGKG